MQKLDRVNTNKFHHAHKKIVNVNRIETESCEPTLTDEQFQTSAVKSYSMSVNKKKEKKNQKPKAREIPLWPYWGVENEIIVFLIYDSLRVAPSVFDRWGYT